MKLYNKCYPDYTLFNEKNAMGGARRKRLWDDFEKDEKDKIKIQIERDFPLTFKISRSSSKRRNR